MQRRRRRKYRIDVRAQRHISPPAPRTHPEDVPHSVDFHVRQIKFAKPLRQPLPALPLAKRRRRHPRHVHLPSRELRLFKAESPERCAHLRQPGNTRHLVLRQGGDSRSGHWRNFFHWFRLSYTEPQFDDPDRPRLPTPLPSHPCPFDRLLRNSGTPLPILFENGSHRRFFDLLNPRPFAPV